MENRISVISIIIEDTAQAAAVNDLLHEYGSYIVGRMGDSLQRTQGFHHLHCDGCPRQRDKRTFRQAGDA